MAVTSIADILSLPVMQDLLDARQFDKTGVLLGTEYVQDVTGDVSNAAGGQTITLPYIADTGDDEVGVQDVNQEDPCATLNSDKLSVLGLDVEVNTSAVSFTNSMDALKRLQNMANPEEVMAGWVVKKAQSKVLRLIYDEIDAAVTLDAGVTATNTLDLAGADATLLDFHKLATMAFGDALDTDQPLNLLHSHVMLDVFQDTTVQQAVAYGNRNDEARWLEFGGYNWKKSDAVPVVGGVYSSYMILPGGALVFLKFDEEFFGHTVRKPDTLCLNTVFPFRYAVGIPPAVNGKVPVARLASGASLAPAAP